MWSENENVFSACIGKTSFLLIQIKKEERTWENGKGPTCTQATREGASITVVMK
jgi:hypothetical protein